MKLALWVDNQDVIGADSDFTEDYIRAAHWTPPVGVRIDGAELEGEDEEKVFAAFLGLAESVANCGHGVDEEDLPAPNLTACPPEFIEEHYKSAAESLARLTSREAKTFAEWIQGLK